MLRINGVGLRNNFYTAKNQISMKGDKRSCDEYSSLEDNRSVVNEYRNYLIEQGYEATSADDMAYKFASCLESCKNV